MMIPPNHVWPADFYIELLTPNQTDAFSSLIDLFCEVFEHPLHTTPPNHLKTLLSNPNFKVFTVQTGGRVVGGLTLYVLPQYYQQKPLAYIYDVGITPLLQGKGLGKALLNHVAAYTTQQGFEAVYVEAEADDTDAIAFYRKSVFIEAQKAIHFNYTCTT